MEGGVLAMSQRERSRLVMMARVREEAMTIKEASEVIGVSYRQSRRIYKRYREEGDKGVIHRNRGRPSNRGKDCKVKEAVLRLYTLEKIQPTTSTHQPGITCVRLPEDISKES